MIQVLILEKTPQLIFAKLVLYIFSLNDKHCFQIFKVTFKPENVTAIYCITSKHVLSKKIFIVFKVIAYLTD